MVKRLASGRREELLDGVMDIIAVRGFSDVTVAEIARELHCSVSTLYRIAPGKDSIVALAIRRWADRSFAELDRQIQAFRTPSGQARAYFEAAANTLQPLSATFRYDVQRFETTRVLWSSVVTDPFIVTFVELLNAAAEAGEIRPVNTLFMSETLRQLAWLMRDETILKASGLTAAQAGKQINDMVWVGICSSDGTGEACR